jgi:hypothetical protein
MPGQAVESPVFGYREFCLYLGDDKLLHGGFGEAWPSAEMEAECLCYAAVPDEAVPIDRYPHHCGIYLLRQPEPLCPGYIGAWCVAWGKVIEHEKGWRVQHCRIERLVLPPKPDPSTIIPLLSHYGVPIEVALNDTGCACGCERCRGIGLCPVHGYDLAACKR